MFVGPPKKPDEKPLLLGLSMWMWIAIGLGCLALVVLVVFVIVLDRKIKKRRVRKLSQKLYRAVLSILIKSWTEGRRVDGVTESVIM